MRMSPDKDHTVRLRMPKTLPNFRDQVYGHVKAARPTIIGSHDREDLILLKSDKRPTYHFANVIDDHYMQITHVIRASVGGIQQLHIKIYSAPLGMARIHAHALSAI